jgi:Ca2+-binding EF-hand superfamily protein
LRLLLLRLFKAFCQSCQDTFKFKFQAADKNKTGSLNLKELTALAGQPPFENKKPEDMFRIVSVYIFYI